MFLGWLLVLDNLIAGLVACEREVRIFWLSNGHKMGGFWPLGVIELVGRDYIFELIKH